MSKEKGFMSRRFFRLANDLHFLKFIASSMTDNAKFQYDEFVKEEVPKSGDKFLEFYMRKEHIDEFLSVYAGNCPWYKTFTIYVNLFSPFHRARVSLKEGLSLSNLSQIQICRKMD